MPLAFFNMRPDVWRETPINASAAPAPSPKRYYRRKASGYCILRTLFWRRIILMPRGLKQVICCVPAMQPGMGRHDMALTKKIGKVKVFCSNGQYARAAHMSSPMFGYGLVYSAPKLKTRGRLFDRSERVKTTSSLFFERQALISPQGGLTMLRTSDRDRMRV